MCGISGIVDASGAALDRATLEAMNDSMRLRGPDDAGVFADGAALLGHRRLSIIDLAGGHQPMRDGGNVVVFNGEIYNFRVLRARLEALGHRFVTASDTEVILKAYRAWGADAVRELDGMFAFALWDGEARRLLLARDRFGKKPLYYFVIGNMLVFASTLTALLQHPQAPRQLDPAAVAEYLALEFVAAPSTILAGVRKLEPASYLLFDAASRHLTSERYWRLRIDGGAGAPVDERELLVELERTLDEAVKKRLVADVPLGVFLSGGLDSSLVTALAARHRHGIKTFSVRFTDPSFDESAYARLVAAHLGTDHHEEELSLDEAVRIAADIGKILDEPVADGSVVPTYLLSRFARRQVTVALGGDGGDELFAGYPTYVAHKLAAWAGPLVRSGAAPWLRQIAARLPVSHDNFSFDFKLKKLLHGLDAPDDERNYVWLGAFERERLGRLFGRDFDVYAGVRARYHEGAGTHLERVLYQDLGLYMCHSVLAKVDRASMAASLEVRAPLLDTRLAELAGRIPIDSKLRGLDGKYLLKKVARRYLPAAIIARKKKGFGMPTGRWLRGELGDLSRDALLDGSSLAATGLFARAEVERLIDEHARGVCDHRQRLWALLVLELWRRENRV